MRILLIPDHLDNWSAHNRTKQLQKRLPFQVDIKAGSKLQELSVQDFAALTCQYDIIHFNYSSYVGGFRPHIEFLLRATSRPFIIGSVIGHRWYAGYEDTDKHAHTLETIAVMKLMDYIYCQTVELQSRLIANGITHTTMIPNGVDREIFPYRRKLVVGHVGPRFEKPVGDYKGGDIVADACRNLGFDFTVPGCYGESRGPLYPGQRAQTDMVTWYKTIDVLCQPSAGEGCSNPISEALAMNIRVIATKEAVTEHLWPYVTLCMRTVEDVMEKLDTSNLIPSWEDVALQFRRMYESVAKRAR